MIVFPRVRAYAWIAIVPSEVNMSNPSYEFPAQYSRFLAEFQALRERHPGADDRFVLADVGSGARRLRSLSGRLPELDCVATEWGAVCKFEPQM